MHRLSFLLLATTLLLSYASVIPSNIPTLRSLDEVPVIHFTISRRGGEFESFAPGGEVANLTYLAEELNKAEQRFNLTRREVKGNKLVRKAKVKGVGGSEVGKLMSNVAEDGRWFARVEIGEPPQEIELDLDMLTSDFYVLTTTSSKGSKYDDYFSKSAVKSNNHPFPRCALPTDMFRMPTLQTSLPLEFAHCRPPKSSSQTLGPSGSMLGLAPSSHLSQIKSPNFLKQLLDKNIIQRPIYSIMLINGQEGVLSIGGTTENAVEMVVKRTKDELDSLATVYTEPMDDENTEPVEDEKTLLKRGSHRSNPSNADAQSAKPDWQENWHWNKVQGAEGWWQILMEGVWIDGSKTIKNQPVVIDINTPFILAPPLAAKTFYASVSGSLQLPPPYQNFYVFPCLNPPVVHFEFDRYQFPVMQGGKGADWFGMPGGRLSLGRYKEGSGYCVGAVVETGMGVRGGGKGEREVKVGELAGNGMRDVWVIGEGFFRGVGGAFDLKEQKVGFRTY